MSLLFFHYSLRRQPCKARFHTEELHEDQALLIGLLPTIWNDWLHDRTDDCDSMWVYTRHFLSVRLFCMNIQETTLLLTRGASEFTSSALTTTNNNDMEWRKWEDIKERGGKKFCWKNTICCLAEILSWLNVKFGYQNSRVCLVRELREKKKRTMNSMDDANPDWRMWMWKFAIKQLPPRIYSRIDCRTAAELV